MLHLYNVWTSHSTRIMPADSDYKVNTAPLREGPASSSHNHRSGVATYETHHTLQLTAVLLLLAVPVWRGRWRTEGRCTCSGDVSQRRLSAAMIGSDERQRRAAAAAASEQRRRAARAPKCPKLLRVSWHRTPASYFLLLFSVFSAFRSGKARLERRER